MQHRNDGKCKKCQEIFNKFPNFHLGLQVWFEQFQALHPEAHISEAGRDSNTQQILRSKGASKANFGQSAHNWNAAIDIFELSGDMKDIYEPAWYNKLFPSNIPDWLKWYGEPGSQFFELPHVEVRNWKVLVEQGSLQLVK